MPAYVIADVREAWDTASLEEYRRRNTEAVANHGGRFVVRGGEQELLEGDWPSLRLVVIEFSDMAAARAWWTSEEYEAIKPLRRAGSTTNIILVAGA